MILDIDSEKTPSHEKRATPSLAIVGRNAIVVAHTPPFDATVPETTPNQLTQDVRTIVRALIGRLDGGGPSASATLADGRHIRVFPLVGLNATYAVSIEYARSEPTFDAIGKRFALSTRESDVLRLLVSGATNAEIARALTIRETTVISHVHNIGTKVGRRKRSTIIARVLGFSGGERPS